MTIHNKTKINKTMNTQTIQVNYLNKDNEDNYSQ
jgi:hypothetical protein